MDTKSLNIIAKLQDISGIDWRNWNARHAVTTSGKNIVMLPTTCANTTTAIVSGDETGQLFVWKNVDCIKEKVLCGNYTAHSTKIQRISFSTDDKYLATIGINDSMICIWRTKPFFTEMESSSSITELSLINEANYSFESVSINNSILGIYIM